jgi:hypothetical protein
MDRENEYENPGGNYPDEGGSSTAAPPAPSNDDPAAGFARTSSESPAEEPATPPPAEPSHQAVGIGVDTTSGGGASTDAEAAASTDHHGQDGSRDTMTAGEAQRTPGALGTEQEQRLPAMSQNNASDVDKIAGIVAQTRSDLAMQPVEEVERVLAQRFEQSGVTLPPEEVAELARQITTGDAARPE